MIKNSECVLSRYDTKNILKDAKTDCESSSKCVGIYDEFCDGRGPYGLCEERF